jgi:hypothetical protein
VAPYLVSKFRGMEFFSSLLEQIHADWNRSADRSHIVMARLSRPAKAERNEWPGQARP